MPNVKPGCKIFLKNILQPKIALKKLLFDGAI